MTLYWASEEELEIWQRINDAVFRETLDSVRDLLADDEDPEE